MMGHHGLALMVGGFATFLLLMIALMIWTGPSSR